MLEFVDSDLYFVQDRNNFINPLLQVGSGSGGPINTGSDRIRILISCKFILHRFSENALDNFWTYCQS